MAPEKSNLEIKCMYLILFIAGKPTVSSGGFNLSFQQLRFQGGAGKRPHRVLSPLLCPARSGQCCPETTKPRASLLPDLPFLNTHCSKSWLLVQTGFPLCYFCWKKPWCRGFTSSCFFKEKFMPLCSDHLFWASGSLSYLQVGNQKFWGMELVSPREGEERGWGWREEVWPP